MISVWRRNYTYVQEDTEYGNRYPAALLVTIKTHTHWRITQTLSRRIVAHCFSAFHESCTKCIWCSHPYSFHVMTVIWLHNRCIAHSHVTIHSSHVIYDTHILIFTKKLSNLKSHCGWEINSADSTLTRINNIFLEHWQWLIAKKKKKRNTIQGVGTTKKQELIDISNLVWPWDHPYIHVQKKASHKCVHT